MLALPVTAQNDHEVCEKKANYAYQVRLLKEDGISDDQFIEWLLEARREAVEQQIMNEDEADEAFVVMLTAWELRGSPYYVATFIYDRCIATTQ